MLRFYDPSAGRISLDGCNLRDLPLATLRRNVSAVLQETLVFDGTIRDNILWGNPTATEAELVAAAVAADAHDFISAMPDGYDTRIGQRGRLCPAAKPAPGVGPGDDPRRSGVAARQPTTGLDAGSAERILAPMRRLMTGRTALVISHNLLTRDRRRSDRVPR